MKGKKKLNRLLVLVTAIAATGLIHNLVLGGMGLMNEGMVLGIGPKCSKWWAAATAVGLSWWWWRQIFPGRGWILILAGGWVNIADRIIKGGVRDYWSLPAFELKNNLPDWLIAAGAVWLVGDYLVNNRRQRWRT